MKKRSCKSYTLYEIQDIKYLYFVEDLTRKEVADTLDISIHRVNNIFRFYIDELKEKRITQEEIDKIICQFKQGYSKKVIAFNFKRTIDSINHILFDNLGYTDVARLVCKKHRKPYTEGELKYIVDNYQDKRYEDIAKDLGRTRMGIKFQIDKLREQGKIGYRKGYNNKNFVKGIYNWIRSGNNG